MTGSGAHDRLFDADRAALLTAVALAVAERFGVQFEELHNDSTTIGLCGQYRDSPRASAAGVRRAFCSVTARTSGRI